jgi:GH25 family lysozyme M1 (1,4-beta-N-acetylmuramidase)
MSFNAIDISSHNAGINIPAMTTTRGVIVKVTQGLSYVNPYFKKHYEAAKKSGKLLSIYHYFGGNDPVKEAEYFWYYFKNYAGEAIPCLDWEPYQNRKFSSGPSVANAFIKRFYELSGIYPIVYMSKSVCRSYDWSWTAARCGLWVAQYANYHQTDYQTHPWTDNKGTGAWKQIAIFQYSSCGRVEGNRGANVDINICYMEEDGWKRVANGDRKQEELADKVDLFPGVDDDHAFVWKAYQTALKGRGYYMGAIDGVWGDKSKAAAKAFQQYCHIDDNGIMNEETVLRLFGLVEI